MMTVTMAMRLVASFRWAASLLIGLYACATTTPLRDLITYLVSLLQLYTERERLLFAELSATRSQVDRLLDQQEMLLGMLARLMPQTMSAPPGGHT